MRPFAFSSGVYLVEQQNETLRGVMFIPAGRVSWTAISAYRKALLSEHKITTQAYLVTVVDDTDYPEGLLVVYCDYLTGDGL